MVAALLAIGSQSSAASLSTTEFLSSYRWRSDDPALGGLSGIELSPDGQRFVVLSDRGRITQGRISRDAEGRITGIEAAAMHRLGGKRDQPLEEGRDDSEGLAWATNGRLYVSLEGEARVLEYDRIDGPARNLPSHKAFAEMRGNASLEALAVDKRGWLYTLPERSGDENRPFPVYVFNGKSWSQPYEIPRDGRFLPVGADFGPDGRFYLLERDFRGIAGFASRVRAFTFGPKGASKGEVVLQTKLGTHDNLEGLSVWRDDKGRIRLTMVSDDNFRFFLRQEVVEYALPVDADEAGH